jgi:hypothetical protein
MREAMISLSTSTPSQSKITSAATDLHGPQASVFPQSLHGHRFCQIAGLVNVATFLQRHVIGE